MNTVWSKFGSRDTIFGEECMDGKFVPIPDDQKRILEKGLREGLQETMDNRDRDDLTSVLIAGQGWTPPTDAEWEQHYLERLEATHWYIYVAVPEDEDYEGMKHEDYTWWDFGVVLTKQVDGEWYVWCEDPSDIGAIWYQSCYTKRDAYACRDLAIEVAEAGGLYNEYDSSNMDNDAGYFYMTQAFGDTVTEQVMTWWPR